VTDILYLQMLKNRNPLSLQDKRNRATIC